MRTLLILLGVTTATLAASWAATRSDKDEPGEKARAELKDREGNTVGTVALEQGPLGVALRATLTGIPPGAHAFHVHQTGKCEPSFEAAGAHVNPLGKEHGFLNARGHHAGDLPNVHVPEAKKLTMEFFVPGVTLMRGPNPLLDRDGAALVVHEHADDYRTHPTGEAGARIACGVVTRM
ncbi:MAG: superoxide dismutase family protein [Deltaproteobacteria bacterium]|nr:superoxide dismutase family protein [Deltaproteobacteria bacterium]